MAKPKGNQQIPKTPPVSQENPEITSHLDKLEHDPDIASILQEYPEILTWWKSLIIAIYEPGILALTKLPIAAILIIYGRLLRQMGPEAVAAAPVIGAGVAAAYAAIRGMITPISTQARDQTAEQIGALARHGTVISLVGGSFVMAGYLSSEQLALLFRIEPSIANIIGTYFRTMSAAAMAYFLHEADLQILLATEQTKLNLALSLLYTAVNIFTCYLLASGVFNLPNFGPFGLALSSASAAISVYTALRSIFAFKKEYLPYNLFLGLFSLNYERKKFIDIISRGSVLCIQNLVEALNPTLLAFIITRFNPTAAIIASPAIQLGLIEASMSLMYSIGVGLATENYNYDLTNIWRIAWSSTLISTSLTGCVGALLIIFSKQASHFLIDSNTITADEFANAERCFRIAMFTLIIDKLRIVFSGSLKNNMAKFEILFTALTSLVFMTILALPLGIVLSYLYDHDFNDPIGFFIARGLGSGAASAIIIARFLSLQYPPVTNSIKSTCSYATNLITFGKFGSRGRVTEISEEEQPLLQKTNQQANIIDIRDNALPTDAEATNCCC